MQLKVDHQNQKIIPILRFIIRFGFLLLFIAGILGLVLFILPYEKASFIVNQFANDGNVEKFSLELFTRVRIPFQFTFTIVSVILFLALLRFDSTFTNLSKGFKFTIFTIDYFKKSWQRLFFDLSHFFDRKMMIGLGLITIVGLILRLFLIHRPMEHDESYTSVIFAFEPLYKGLSDYHFPNNHVFHTFFVHIAYKLFGAQEWSVRLPALISGVLLIPTGFVLAKAWYGRKTAILSAVMIAVFPELIRYSTNARGYTLMALLTLLLFISGTYVKNHRNSAAWFLTGLFGALGFYTLPIMAYPLLVLYSWLGFSWLISDYCNEYSKKGFLGFTFLSGFFSLGLGFALYIPIFKNWGIRSLLANNYTQALSVSDFGPTLISRLTDTWNMLNQGAIPFIGVFLLTGLFLSFIQFKKIGKDKIPLQITSIVVIGILIAIQRPNVYYRTWIFYIPLLCIWSSVGWLVTINSIFRDNPKSGKLQISTILSLCLGLIFLLNGVIHTIRLIPASQNGSGDVEKATLFIKDHLVEDDIVVITATDDAPMWFYFEKYGLGRGYFSRIKPFTNAYVVVTNNTDQTIQSVIKERGPDLGFFDLESAVIIEKVNTLDIYLIKANAEAIQKAYGDWKK